MQGTPREAVLGAAAGCQVSSAHTTLCTQHSHLFPRSGPSSARRQARCGAGAAWPAHTAPCRLQRPASPSKPRPAAAATAHLSMAAQLAWRSSGEPALLPSHISKPIWRATAEQAAGQRPGMPEATERPLAAVSHWPGLQQPRVAARRQLLVLCWVGWQPAAAGEPAARLHVAHPLLPLHQGSRLNAAATVHTLRVRWCCAAAWTSRQASCRPACDAPTAPSAPRCQSCLHAAFAGHAVPLEIADCSRTKCGPACSASTARYAARAPFTCCARCQFLHWGLLALSWDWLAACTQHVHLPLCCKSL